MLLPLQLGRQMLGVASINPENKPAFTGAIFCPQRWSHIAVLRCSEYQRECGCGFACKNAVTPVQVKAVIVQSRQDVDAEDTSRGLTARKMPCCVTCGKPKKTPRGRHCRACGSAINGTKSGRLTSARLKAKK